MDDPGGPAPHPSLRPADRPADPVSDRRATVAAAVVIIAAGTGAYANTLTAPFVFDDLVAIIDNPSIHSLGGAFFPPATAGGAAGRPLVNLSFALNHALGGGSVVGYHALNLLIHVAAGLTLFGFARRTLLLPILRDRWAPVALPVAFFSALLWTVHPLLTESVTCIVQRTESLAGLWFLLLFYCLARAAGDEQVAGSPPGSGQSPTPSGSREPAPTGAARWRAGAFVACLLGVFTKEIMVMAPILAVAYHALLVDCSWRSGWMRRKRFLAVLALTWVPLALLVGLNGTRHGAGFGQGVAWWEYALTQCRAVPLYLKLAAWPHPLVLDHGTGIVRGLSEVWPQALLLGALLAGTVFAAVRKLPVAFAGLWFFLILAPSSSVLPLVTQPIAEHRMYLPLAALVVPFVAGVRLFAGRWGIFFLVVLAGLLVAGTWRRNADYGTALALWSDTVAKAPDNARAHNNLGNVLDDAGREDEAMREYERALALDPDYAATHYNLGNLLARRDQPAGAIDHFRASIRAEPGDATAHAKLGVLLVQSGQHDAGVAELRTALRLAPGNPLARDELARLGLTLAQP